MKQKPKPRSPLYRERARMRRNLRRLYYRVTESDRLAGLSWYPSAAAEAQTLADRHGYDHRTIAACIAAISPQCNWNDNLRIARELVSGAPKISGGALPGNVRIAKRALADRAIAIDPYFQSAPKVCAFARNLSGDGEPVTVDSHAVQAALNDPLFRKGLKVAPYRIVADVYQAIAREFGLRPCD